MQPRIRTVTTPSGATAVQIIYSYAGGVTSMEHIGSAHTDVELAAMKADAARRLQGDQLELGLDLGDAEVPTSRGTGTADQPWEVTAQRSGYLLDAINNAYTAIGLDTAAGGDIVFAGLVTAGDPATRLEVRLHPGLGRKRSNLGELLDDQTPPTSLRHRRIPQRGYRRVR